MFFNDEVTAAYEALDKICKLKAKREIKGTKIIIERVLKATDLVKGNEFYIVELNNVTIRFKKPSDFYSHIRRYAQQLKKEAVEERGRIEYHRSNDMHFDDVTYDPIIDGLWHQEAKLDSFIEKMNYLLEKS